ncbi:MAG: hypothetical protein Q4B80_01825 [Aerococcaceae bacterium]|nr:hypothetical protein [Aerococcaceae bacterium]
MAKIQVEVNKADMKAMEEMANHILKQRGIDPEQHRYEQNLRLVMDNTKLFTTEKE